MRCFNVTGACSPQRHYMVDIGRKLEEIKKMIDAGAYFTINRARQYGKTTTIRALTDFLADDYVVLSLDFQKMDEEEFETGRTFAAAFADYLADTIRNKKRPVRGLANEVILKLESVSQEKQFFSLRKLFKLLNELCDTADKPVVLIIDEVDSAANNQVFLDFLAQLRSDYLNRDFVAAFQSVILAGVYDVKNIKRKIRPDEMHKTNSPWNVAADFLVDMSFSKEEIKGMLADYEAEHCIGMNLKGMAELLYDYTSGYPYLVSKYCKLIDERIMGTDRYPDGKAAWTREGFLEANKILLAENNTLFESLIHKLTDYPELDEILRTILLTGQKLTFNPDMPACQLGAMFGFIKDQDGVIEITNRVFETRLYNYYLSESQLNDALYLAAGRDKNQFFKNGMLDMDLVIRKFVTHYHEIYGDNDQKFVEKYGRMFFLLYLRPLINGVGNYYIEAQTRDVKRTDLIVDYLGKQFIVEMKIWDGPKYHREGEDQLVGYLERYHLEKGYLLTFSFLKNKKIGVKEVSYCGKILVEATV